MKTDNTGIWLRCWDGSEMEYEHWTHNEITELVLIGWNNYRICLIIQTIPSLDFSKYLDDLRGGISG